MRALVITIIFLAVSFTGKAQTVIIDEGADKIYTVVEKEPEFSGGQKAYNKFLSKNLKWPDKSGMIDVQGKVLVSFVVEKDGTLTNFRITRSLQQLFDAEALRVIKLSPKWEPGGQGGKPVRVAYTMPLSFTLKN